MQANESKLALVTILLDAGDQASNFMFFTGHQCAVPRSLAALYTVCGLFATAGMCNCKKCRPVGKVAMCVFLKTVVWNELSFTLLMYCDKYMTLSVWLHLFKRLIDFTSKPAGPCRHALST